MRRQNQALYDTDHDAWERIQCVIAQLHDADVLESEFEERLRCAVRRSIQGVSDQARRIYLHDLITRTARATIRRTRRAETHRLDRYMLQLDLQAVMHDAAAREATQPIGTCEGARGELSPDHVA